ncbi:MAG: DNA-directed DNA polymerase II small subunit [Candidatus Hodarchaeaceae archaeon]|nr:DNA-directed DNA polymerase II small subunit [Candidatus Hodarchaeaceae archaeon]
MDERALVRKFMDADMQLTKGALEVLRGREDVDAVANQVLLALRETEGRPFMITADFITKVLEGGVRGQQGQLPQVQPPAPPVEVKPEPSEVEKRLPELAHVKFKPAAAEHESRIRVLKDITGKSYSEGELKDFVGLFKDRYERLSRMLQKREDLYDAVPISSLGNLADGRLVKVIGMVSQKRESSAGNVMIELEDPTGRISAFVFKGSKALMQKAAEVVPDEVIGVVASLRSGDRGPRLFVRDIIWPDLPVRHELHRAEDPVCAALISDLHVGSEMFVEDMFLKFVKWLRGEEDGVGQQELASKVKYLVIAGDIVDGIGVYPQQEKELLINDIYKQYDTAAKLLSQVPEHITIIIAPGNHDAVRPSEPQPAISERVAGGLYELNSVMVGNPVWLSLHGVSFLVYHGRSFDDIIATMPGLNRQKSTPPMIRLLQKRHLAPIYGGRTAMSPEQQDYLVIEDVPDVFHCGHIHVWGYERYRDVSVVNSGTFQERTRYMQQLGVRPTPGIVSVLDLQTHQTKVISFA